MDECEGEPAVWRSANIWDEMAQDSDNEKYILFVDKNKQKRFH